MNTDYDVETLADVLFEALSLSSSILESIGRVDLEEAILRGYIP